MLASRRTEGADPVVMSRLIAQSLLGDIQSSGGKQADPLSVINLLRLMDIYESQNFRVRQSLGTLQYDDFTDLNELRGSDRLQRLKTALANTHRAYGPELTVPEFTARIRHLFLAFTAKQKATDIDVAGAEQFLTELTKALSAA